MDDQPLTQSEIREISQCLSILKWPEAWAVFKCTPYKVCGSPRYASPAIGFQPHANRFEIVVHEDYKAVITFWPNDLYPSEAAARETQCL